ncbi:MAG: hypothetical protein QOE58_1738 [Actinomycetota bacterium]|jgi:hypothetical protein|nr:hypothetical protein [Actinomycetota bacterium]
MFGQIGQPEMVGRCGPGLAGDEVVVDRRPWPAIEAAFAGVHRPEPLLGAEPVDPIAARGDPSCRKLVGDEPVAELRVVMMYIDRGVDQVRVVPIALTDRFPQPGIEPCLLNFNTRQVTATGIPSAARSRTSG